MEKLIFGFTEVIESANIIAKCNSILYKGRIK